MRDWHLTADSPLSMRFAADVRLTQTDYVDDQSWEIVFGKDQEPAVAFTTRYGGRAGLARLVPMWVIDNTPIYEAAAYAEKPVLRAFAPNYARITARPTSTLGLTAELWVMDSHSIGLRYSLENTSSQAISLRLEMFAQIVREGEMINMNLLGLDDGTEALHLGVVGNLNPILLLDGATAEVTQPGEHVSPKLSAPITIAAGEHISVRCVHTGRPSLNESLQVAFRWLNRTDWDAGIRAIEQANVDLPVIDTGNTDWDAVIAFSNQVVLRSFISATANLPGPSYVSARIPSRGFSPHGDGSDHGWQWNGQTAALGYLALPAAAILAPELATAAVMNALAVQQPDGWIDFKPGLVGQRANMLSFPAWASIAWGIYESTENRQLIEDAFAGLVKFFERWFQPDMDKDKDGLPEWTSINQSIYTSNPLFARFQRWAQNGDISRAETPDMAAYLISEAHSLIKMAVLLGKQNDPQVNGIHSRIDTLDKHLESMWDEGAGNYRVRDRDTDQLSTGAMLFTGKGDESFDTRTQVNPPNRLILRVIGGKNYTPKVSATIEGVNAKGQSVAESIPVDAFAWHYGMGSAVSEQAYSQINYVKFEGLSRVYSVEISTVDLNRSNQTCLLPLWASVGSDHSVRLVSTITDEKRYWRPYGMPVCPIDDPAFVANNDGGSGGVWMLWNTMIAEGLLSHGRRTEAIEIFTRLMDAQTKVLRSDHGFREAYNSETGEGLGDIDELSGVMPLQLVMELVGIRVINRRRVWAGGAFALPHPVKVIQFGVEITRSDKGTAIKFPTGYTVEVGPDWQLIEDPTPEPVAEIVVDHPVTTEASTESDESVSMDLLNLPATASVIPVDAKKDDTMEIPISQIDFTPKRDPSSEPPQTGTPGVIRIPVNRPESDE